MSKNDVLWSDSFIARKGVADSLRNFGQESLRKFRPQVFELFLFECSSWTSSSLCCFVIYVALVKRKKVPHFVKSSCRRKSPVAFTRLLFTASKVSMAQAFCTSLRFFTPTPTPLCISHPSYACSITRPCSAIGCLFVFVFCFFLSFRTLSCDLYFTNWTHTKTITYNSIE